MATVDDVDGCAVLDELTATPTDAETTRAVLERHNLSDGLPVVAPAPQIVARMVAASGCDPDRSLGPLPPLRGELTPTRLGAVAAIAGCDPEHMPVLVAAMKALLVPEVNTLGLSTTTGSAALMTIVHGPIRNRAGFNSGANLLGPGNRSNATVGRCLSLVSRIVGGAREGCADMATMGQPAKYSFCFAENEEASPWPPWHESQGCASGTSAVTVAGVGGTVEAFDPSAIDAEPMVRALGRALAGASPVVYTGRGLVGGGHQTVLVSPEWADTFDRAGWSRADLQTALFDEGRRVGGLRVAETPTDIVVVVAGSVGIKQTVIPGWSGGSAPVTVPIAEPTTP